MFRLLVTAALAAWTVNAAPFSPELETRAAISTELRILPLGDSITYGYASPDHNGYRLRLRDTLIADGDKVVFAGVYSYGNMTDPFNSGYSGHTIKYISGQAPQSTAQNPNIILLMAGTNDMNSNLKIATEGNDPQGAADRLDALVGQLFSAVPNTVVLLAKIGGVCDTAQNDRITQFNKLVGPIVTKRKNSGQHIKLVDMTFVTCSGTIDGIHPDEAHYQTMGQTWHNAIAALPSAWIQTPVGPDPVRS